jgi:lysophospholipase L1-like esterase
MRVAIVIVLTATAFSAAEQFNPPKQFYLSLGDSIAYGYQASKARAHLPAAAFDTGYVDDFAARLREITPGITVVNYGCPGETTRTFVNGGCIAVTAGFELHDSFSGSQLDTAVAFLHTHRGQVSPITLTLWGNDVSEFIAFCNGDLACIQHAAPTFIVDFSQRLAAILSQLRDAAPDAEIIVTGGWDSNLEVLPFADPLFQLLNSSMSAVSTAARARFADPFPVFNPQGDLAREIETMCTLTLLCTENDSHPSDIGYQALAQLVFDASGYARFLR